MTSTEGRELGRTCLEWGCPGWVPIPHSAHVAFLWHGGVPHPRRGLWGTGNHLTAPVTGISLKQPLHSGLGRARLALEEGGAACHTVLHGLHGVLVGCRTRERDMKAAQALGRLQAASGQVPRGTHRDPVLEKGRALPSGTRTFLGWVTRDNPSPKSQAPFPPRSCESPSCRGPWEQLRGTVRSTRGQARRTHRWS